MTFDPKKFINCDHELAEFEGLIAFKSTERILAIRDEGGNGKSQLLEKLGHRCRTGKPRIPVSLQALDQLQDYSPLFVVKSIVQQLNTSFNLKFGEFDRFETARVAGNYSLFTSAVNLQSANFSGASNTFIASTGIQTAEKVTIVGTQTTLTPAQEMVAQSRVISAFFEDLLKYAAQKPVVMILDSYDRCKPELQEWIVNTLLPVCFFGEDARPSNLVLVVGGRELPRYDLGWPEDRCAELVKIVDGLSRWQRRHVQEYLDAHGFEYSNENVDLFLGFYEKGISTLNLITAMQALLKKR